LGRNFDKFGAEKHDFDLCKRFFMRKKKDPNWSDFEIKIKIKLPNVL